MFATLAPPLGPGSVLGLDEWAVRACEVLAVAFTLICVWLTVKQNIWCWPVGIVAIAFFFIVFLESALYADTALQVVYFMLSVYGWYYWLHGGRERTQPPVTRTPWRVLAILIMIHALGTYLCGRYLSTTNASVPYWDSAMMMLSLIAQWMMAVKYLESWLAWIASNLLQLGIYLFKELELTAALQIVLMILSVMGFLAWRREMRGRVP